MNIPMNKGPYKQNYNDFSFSDYPTHNYPSGWVCPKCGRVLAPSVAECPYHSEITITCTDNHPALKKLAHATIKNDSTAATILN